MAGVDISDHSVTRSLDHFDELLHYCSRVMFVGVLEGSIACCSGVDPIKSMQRVMIRQGNEGLTLPSSIQVVTFDFSNM
ncbi:hypothetical protein AKJ16_DCAP09929 [Drosera capensis]